MWYFLGLHVESQLIVLTLFAMLSSNSSDIFSRVLHNKLSSKLPSNSNSYSVECWQILNIRAQQINYSKNAKTYSNNLPMIANLQHRINTSVKQTSTLLP